MRSIRDHEAAALRVNLEDAVALLGACAAPSEAFWRLIELEAVRGALAEIRPPVLELGCGDGLFTQLAGIRVDLGIDRQRRAVERSRRRSEVYARVAELDIHDLNTGLGTFETVYANSVLEHLEGIDAALRTIGSALVPGGRLVATVPLRTMNDFLAVGGHRYMAWRQRQLEHRNLWSKTEWMSSLVGAGFIEMSWTDYLPGDACRFWDRVDVLGAIGTGRYRVAPVLHHATSRLLPASTRDAAKWRLGSLLLDRVREFGTGPPCAGLLVARSSR
jgi:SAM-dependent methyltransferase